MTVDFALLQTPSWTRGTSRAAAAASTTTCWTRSGSETKVSQLPQSTRSTVFGRTGHHVVTAAEDGRFSFVFVFIPSGQQIFLRGLYRYGRGSFTEQAQ